MTVPARYISPQDGGNAVTMGATGPRYAIIGSSTTGSYNTPGSYASPTSLKAVFGAGPAVDLACKLLEDAGGTCIFVRALGSTAAATTEGTHNISGTSTGDCVASGTAVNDYQIKVEILSSGDVGVATFRYSLDAGPDDDDDENKNWSNPILVPAGGAYTLGSTGLTITFSGGATTAFTDGDCYYWSTSAPAPTLSDLQTALDAIRASTYDVDWIHIVGESSNSIMAGVKTKVDSWETTYNRYSFVVLEATDLDPVGAVTKSGTTPPTLAVTGLPFGSHDFAIDITLGGDIGTMKFKYSVDGGALSDEITSTTITGITTIGAYGITLTFPTGTYNVDNADTFSTWDKETNRAVWDAALRAAYTTTSDKIIVCAGFGECTQSDGQIRRRSIAWGISSLIGKVGLSTDLGSIDDAGQLPGFVSLSHDEYKNPGLDDLGFCVGRTWNSADGSLRGFYCNQGRIMAPAGSDYDLVQYRRVMNAAFKALDPVLARTVNKKVKVDPDTGYILERYARALDRLFTSAVESVTTKKGHGSGVVVAMQRDENLLSTRHGHVDVQIIGDAYIKTMTARIGYMNPALVEG
jgi:hypothetical protein